MEASGAKFQDVVGLGTRPPPLPLPELGAWLALAANRFGGNVKSLRTLVALFSWGLEGLKVCVANSASATMIAACDRKERPCARLARADLSKRKRCNGAPFAELIFHLSGVKASRKFPRMR